MAPCTRFTDEGAYSRLKHSLTRATNSPSQKKVVTVKKESTEFRQVRQTSIYEKSFSSCNCLLLI